MKPGQLLRLFALPAVVVSLASCASVEPVPSRPISGASLDQPPDTRYAPGVTQSGDVSTTPSIEDDLPDTGAPGTSGTQSSGANTSGTSSITPEGTSSTTTETPKPQTTPSEQPSYGTPVPGRSGFVYPPGVQQKPENMVDVRDFTPGQKVRDPRTGKIFLVP